jgi:predicted MFS family arabinose efflux permease
LNSTAIDLSRHQAPTHLERWYVLVTMCAIYALNIADRYVVSTVLEPIRLELRLTDAGVAFLTGVPLALFYVAFGLPISWLADRFNRRNILAAALILWSAFTVICGLSRSYLQLLLARVGVGVGEAGGLPPSSSIVSDCFPADRRPMAFTVLALGAPIGAWLGADMAGAVAHAYGWRAAFLALGAPGVVLGVLAYLTIREPPRGRLDAERTDARSSLLGAARFLWSQRAAFHVLMGSGVCSLWGWGLIWWTPAFLMRTYRLDVGEAGAITGPIHLLGGMAATAGTAWLLSRPYMAAPRRVLWLLGSGVTFATLPSFIAYWTHTLWLAKLMLWLYIPAIYFFIGPCMGLLQNLAPAHLRSMFIALSLLVGNVLNLIVAPQAVGLASDFFAHGGPTDADSLRLALLLLAPTGLWAVGHFYLANKTVIADLDRALRREQLRRR